MFSSDRLRIFCFGLLAVITLLLGSATIIESFTSTSFVLKYIYTSPYFIILWAVLVLFSLVYIFKRKCYKPIVSLAIHLSFVFILFGALVTHLFGEKGVLHLRKGTPVGYFKTERGSYHHFPFKLILKDFRIDYYLATETPQDFVSLVEFYSDSHSSFSEEVSMNHIVSYEAYRFYQSGYDPDNKGTYLSVSYDPYGVIITYLGYALLLGSMLLFFFSKKTEFSRLIKSPILKQLAIASFLLLTPFHLLLAMENETLPQVLPEATAQDFCNLYTLYNGRVCPLQSLAKDFTLKLHGKSSYKAFSSEQVFTGWLFYYYDWAKEAMIKVDSPEIKDLLGIEGNYASFFSLFNDRQEYKLAHLSSELFQEKKSLKQKDIQKVEERYSLIVTLRMGKLIQIYPYNKAGHIKWYLPNDRFPSELSKDQQLFFRKSIAYLLELAEEKKFSEFSEFCAKVRAYQERELGAEFLPSKSRFKAEKLYNKSDYSALLFKLSLTFGLSLLIYFVYCFIKSKQLLRFVLRLANVYALIVFLYLSYYLGLRAYVSGYFPVTNGYEIMQSLAWGALLLSLILQSKFRIVLPFGILLSGLTLLVASLGQSSPKITNLMPVLSSPLLSVHVVTIMLSYLLCAFMMFNGLVALLLNVVSDRAYIQIRQLQLISQVLLYPTVFLLSIGTFIGAVWANISWGRYWGWDPKEVWALVTMLVYTFPLHSKSLKMFRTPIVFHTYMVLAFSSVLFTYFGVNYLLGGLHSYANS